MRSSGQALGPSDSAFAGIGMGFHEQAGDAGRHGGPRQHRDELALAAGAVPCPPGNCTEWVASNTTGQPVARMIASARMSDTRLL